MKNSEKIITTESAVNLQEIVSDLTDPNNPLASDNMNTGSVIPENDSPHDDTSLKSSNIENTGHPRTSLPGIDVFLNRTCTIPLIRCAFKTIKTAVETRGELIGKDDSQKLGKNPDSSNQHPSSDPSSPTTQTSTHKRTVIDYKKFLEEFVDLPPSPPKRKCEVDLKCRPSRSRIAAEKYRKTDFVTKPLSVPKPVRRKAKAPKAAPSASIDANTDESLTQGTITKPATTQETQDTIDALLLLGNMGMPPSLPENPEDNEVLMPIGGNSTVNDDNSSSTNIALITTTTVSTSPPKVGTVLGWLSKVTLVGNQRTLKSRKSNRKITTTRMKKTKPRRMLMRKTKTRVQKTIKRKLLLPDSLD